MGLIKAAIGAVSGTLADTWKDYFVCETMGAGVLVTKGVKKGKGLFDSSDVITNGSGIVVADGQCALIVDDGVIVEVANEPGNYTFDTTKSPSIFDGGFAGIKDTFKEIVERFTYGGTTAKSQHVYYVNTKEIMGNMFGTTTPVPFRVVDQNANIDIDISLRCNGEYSFAISNPLLFYKNVAAGTAGAFTKDKLESQMRTELLTALQPALGAISALGIRYSEITNHTMELAEALNQQLNARWTELRGIKIMTVTINSVSASKEDEAMLKNIQKAAVNKDAAMREATLTTAAADAMVAAANNPNGAMNGFVNLNIAQNQAAQVTQLYGQTTSGASGQMTGGGFCPQCGKQVPAGAKFCPFCGAQLA